MPMYIATGSYTSEGIAGLARSGATERTAQLAAVAKGLGGRLEAMYFGLAENDTFIEAYSGHPVEVQPNNG